MKAEFNLQMQLLIYDCCIGIDTIFFQRGKRELLSFALLNG
jgi:hypothetical protein